MVYCVYSGGASSALAYVVEASMGPSRWSERFFASTRGRILLLLRRASRTVDELAGALGLTDNAVRTHLASLERDALVQQEGVRRSGVGKPAYFYELTPEAESLFPKAYGLVLHRLLEVLGERISPEDQLAIMRELGHRLAAGQEAPDGELRSRVEHAVALLGKLGGEAELVEEAGRFTIRGYSCPLAAAIPGHPEVCEIAETLLADVLHVPVRERCQKEEPPRCCFEIGPGPEPNAELSGGRSR
ncbi:MAG: ArsR family transcriptional regulator [Chloroflexi bacterium]|nr:ArsR family transcriptional regulator [Chloroflexota bacterium]